MAIDDISRQIFEQVDELVTMCVNNDGSMQQKVGDIPICGYGAEMPCDWRGPDFRLVKSRSVDDPLRQWPKERTYRCKYEKKELQQISPAERSLIEGEYTHKELNRINGLGMGEDIGLGQG
ncbi:hypothetical protein CMO88_02615 [Candidatus Woesearchaeota archaeon]|nr:hypothetical protein [Candidatus Woesearchaeota archaeon]|tara:strand:- start:6097 stop:6459 length:363 start_codon:yes stop_codon:yes gene_type:complete